MKKVGKLLSPFRKNKNDLPNLIFLALEETSEELILYVLAINNKNLSTKVSDRESLKRRLAQIAHQRSGKIIIPCLVFSVKTGSEVVNKICPLPYSQLEHSDQIEKGNIKIYEYHTFIDHLKRGVKLKELEKTIKNPKNPAHKEIIDYITEVGDTNFKNKLEQTIDNFCEKNSLGRNSKIRLKRSEKDICSYLYNYDSSFFNSIAKTCEYHPSGLFSQNVGTTMVYHSNIEESTNADDKTYLVQRTSSFSSEESESDQNVLQSPMRVLTSSEESEVSENIEPVPFSNAIALQEQTFSVGEGEESRTAIETLNHPNPLDLPNNHNVPIMATTESQIDTNPHNNIQEMSHNEQNMSLRENGKSQNQDDQNAPTSPELSDVIYQHLGPTPFRRVNEKKGKSKDVKDLFAKTSETEKLLAQTHLSNESIQRLNKAAKLKPELNNTNELIDLGDTIYPEGEKTKVNFDSHQNEVRYFPNDQSSSLKKPKFGDKSKTFKNPLKLPPSIVKKPKTKPVINSSSNARELINQTDLTQNTLAFQPELISTPHPKKDSKTNLPEYEPTLLANNYTPVEEFDCINPGSCFHGKKDQKCCPLCIKEKIEFANKHHQDYVSNPYLNKTENISNNIKMEPDSTNKKLCNDTNNKQTKNINTLTKTFSESKNNTGKKNEESPSSSESSERNHKKNKKSKKRSRKSKKKKESTEEPSSDSDSSFSDFESKKYSNLSSSSKFGGCKLKNTFKYPKLTREVGLDPDTYFTRFIDTLQINLGSSSVEDINNVMLAKHILSEQMVQEFGAQREIFLNLSGSATDIQSIRKSFLKSLSESVILREKRFEDISEKAKDIDWRSFASNLLQLFKHAYPEVKHPLTSDLLIMKLKGLIPKELRKSYELTKVGGNCEKQDVFQIAETLDRISSFSALEKEEKSVYSIDRLAISETPKVNSRPTSVSNQKREQTEYKNNNPQMPNNQLRFSSNPGFSNFHSNSHRNHAQQKSNFPNSNFPNRRPQKDNDFRESNNNRSFQPRNINFQGNRPFNTNYNNSNRGYAYHDARKLSNNNQYFSGYNQSRPFYNGNMNNRNYRNYDNPQFNQENRESPRRTQYDNRSDYNYRNYDNNHRYPNEFSRRENSSYRMSKYRY